MRPLPRLPFFVLASIGLCLLMPGPQAFADGLGFFEARRLLSDADAALAAGRLDEAAEAYARVADGTASGKSRHARALLGAVIAELSRNGADADLAHHHLDAYLADSAADQKVIARALKHLLDEVESQAPTAAPVAAPEPAPAAGRDDSKDQARIAELQRQLAAARDEIQQKEKLIEELRKIVVEGGG